MISLQGKDGQLNIIDQGNNGTTHFLKVVFSNMDFVGPTNRPRPAESIVLIRGKMDSDAYYIEEDDTGRYTPMPVNFSCSMTDSSDSIALHDLVNGESTVSGSQVYSTKGYSTIDGNQLPSFSGTTKFTYTVEMLWGGGTTNYGLQYNEVFFLPGSQAISEQGDSVVISTNGLVYGGVSRINSLTTAGLTSF